MTIGDHSPYSISGGVEGGAVTIAQGSLATTVTGTVDLIDASEQPDSVTFNKVCVQGVCAGTIDEAGKTFMLDCKEMLLEGRAPEERDVSRRSSRPAENDVMAQAFELADETAGVGGAVVSATEPVGAEARQVFASPWLPGLASPPTL